jgi:hypothetical protein
MPWCSLLGMTARSCGTLNGTEPNSRMPRLSQVSIPGRLTSELSGFARRAAHGITRQTSGQSPLQRQVRWPALLPLKLNLGDPLVALVRAHTACDVYRVAIRLGFRLSLRNRDAKWSKPSSEVRKRFDS